MFIADSQNNVIRLVSNFGIITTFAGDKRNRKAGTGIDGPATSSLLNNPIGVTVDNADNVYIADTLNQVIRAVMRSTGMISTFAGTMGISSSGSNFEGASPVVGGAYLNKPSGLAYNIATGSLYITESGSNNVHVVCGYWTPDNSKIFTIAGSYLSTPGRRVNSYSPSGRQ